MKIGTKSVLYGAHCFFLHPWFVALAWWRLYGFPFDPRLWLAFFVHDLGYLGKPDMDGEEGEKHPRLGSTIMHRLVCWWSGEAHGSRSWCAFSFYHSRFLAKRRGVPFSRLCVADKLAVALEPWWLYLPRVIATGEVEEYMAASRAAALGRDQLGESKYSGEPQLTKASEVAGLSPRRAWHKVMTTYCRQWAITHADGRLDKWTAGAPEGSR